MPAIRLFRLRVFMGLCGPNRRALIVSGVVFRTLRGSVDDD
jgi:hypothetical protein